MKKYTDKIYKTAKGFNNLLNSIDRNTICLNQNFGLESIHFALITNMAFVLELSLKAIIYEETDGVPKTHNLKKLFNKLSKNKQINFFKFINNVSEEKLTNNEILNMLNEISENFIEFRYPFEKPIETFHVFLESSKNYFLDILHKGETNAFI